MTTETGIRQELEITSMTSFVFLRFNTDGSIDGRIDPRSNRLGIGTGSVRINGTKITITSHEFTQIYPS